MVFTCGGKGAYILDHGTAYEQPAAPAPDLIDTLGAGDAFIAAFLVRYTDTGGDVPESARYAAEFAAQNCGHYGAFGRPYRPGQD